ncbi:DNA repair protein RadA [Candidatus Nomurabacteria bacterium]|nr:DNA repair protein RadA [Candidatus Nomurabacteria bacterium]
MKTQTLFACNTCGAQFKKWAGRCLECGKWGTVEQEVATAKVVEKKQLESRPTAKLSKASSGVKHLSRLEISLPELSRVLGGGFVPGSFLLLGGEPGIGKSTLSAQIAAQISGCMYFSGEESTDQVGMRIERLGLSDGEVFLSNETHVETIAATILQEKPKLAIVDSIQTIYSEDAAGETGSTSQVRACAVKLLDAAKQSGTCVILIGHVTKEGSVAGPRTLEHLVDTVLYLEGDRYHQIRVLRAVKNRFGSTDEIGLFKMTEKGLEGISNPSENLLSERAKDLSGSVVTCLLEGTRPILVEVQALVNKTVFGYPLRKSSGFDINRLHLLLAVLEKRAGLPVGQYDVHVNVVGGIKANEPGADLAVAIAVASSFKDKALGNDLVVFGEVGLGGEIRSVRQVEKRIKECAQLGMKRVITKIPKKSQNKNTDVNVIGVENISDLVQFT